jgi:hypothetical protein
VHRDVMVSCLPLLIALAVSIGALPVLARLSGARLDLNRLRRLHADQLGGVQSLSFVVTLPVFMMIMMFIVQLSQLTIAKIMVEYSAFAAARSAQVWIPATLGMVGEQENQIGGRLPEASFTGPDGRQYEVYQIESGGRKYNKIHLAAATALMPICPSRDVGASRDHPGNASADPLVAAFAAIAPETNRNTRIPRRIRNKLAYALENTQVMIEVAHKDEEPPLAYYDIPPHPEEFAPTEIGWQDQVAVTVTHDFALLPGPGRLLARPAPSPESGFTSESPANAQLTETIKQIRGVYTYPLRATARLSNEGEKSVLPFIQAERGVP